MEISFKNASVDDINKIFKLNKNLIEKYETNSNLDFEKIFDWVRKKIEKNIDSYQCIYFERIKVGYYYLHNKGEQLELDDFFIFDEFQRRGIGTEILKYAASIAKKQNKDIFLYVFIKNQGAVNLYLRNGYQITENIHNSRYLMSLKNNN
ncbi:GNAT family N-acetyltransferase [Haloimpatiens sp. FM7330]|uniref:GNAT family N-acetyltransferase n=1 Tax=Haloimpatiens sp. FM7330 TaxID=3298610 RepID=UPI0036292EDE